MKLSFLPHKWPWKRSLLKTLWEKEKMLVTSISPFPKSFQPFQKQISIFSVTSILPSAYAFNVDQSKILLFGKELKE